MTGLSLNKYMLQGHWLCSMIGFNFCFFPMHYFGLCGFPRRVCVYDPRIFWLEGLCSLGAFLSVVSAFFMMLIIWESLVVMNKVVSLWGSSGTVLSIAVVPVPQHTTYLGRPSHWICTRGVMGL